MIREFWAWLLHRPRPEYPIDHPIRQSRELVTEARLREAVSQRIVRDAAVQPGGRDLVDYLDEMRRHDA